MPIGVTECLDVRILGIPIVSSTSRLRPNDAHRSALRVGCNGAVGANRQSEVDAARDNGLKGFSSPRRVYPLELETVLLENAGLVAKMGDRGIPIAPLAKGHFNEVVGHDRITLKHHCDRRGGCNWTEVFHGASVLPDFFNSF